MPVANYFWDEDEDNVIEEYDSGGTTVATYTTEPRLYGNVISQYRDGLTSYFHYNGVGNTAAVTDDDGDVTDTRGYSAFGEPTESSGTTTFPYQYVGQRGYHRDQETGGYYVRARMYEPNIARWMSRDPLRMSVHRRHHAEAEQIEGEFQYVGNSPVLFSDPSGLTRYWCCEIWSPKAKEPRYGYIWTWGWLTNPRRICKNEYDVKADDVLFVRERSKGGGCKTETNPDVFFVRESTAEVCCGKAGRSVGLGHWDIFSLRRGMVRLGYKGSPERAKKWNLNKGQLPGYRDTPVYPHQTEDTDYVLQRIRFESQVLQFGAGAGTSCNTATSTQVADCLNKADIPDRWPLHCQIDVACAVYACCLLSLNIWKPTGCP